MGCSANNRVKEGDKPAPENRRVAFILINESRAFPVNFPCQDGAEAGCAGQCKKAGKRSAAGIRCAFYDELLREVVQIAASDSLADSKAGDVESYDIEKAVSHISENAHEKTQGRCARYVRLALQAGGAKIDEPYPLSAKDYGPRLIEAGFTKVILDSYVPMKGDVAVFQAPSTNQHGHIQMFDGQIWVSDFTQNKQGDIYPGGRYRDEKVSYEVYRP